MSQFAPQVKGSALSIWKCQRNNRSLSINEVLPFLPVKVKMKMLLAQLCPTLCDPMDCSPPGSSVCPWDSPGKNPGVGSSFLLQGIFPTQGLNPGFLHHRQILYHLSHQGSDLSLLGRPQLACIQKQYGLCVWMGWHTDTHRDAIAFGCMQMVAE